MHEREETEWKGPTHRQDGGEADDKIIAVCGTLRCTATYGRDEALKVIRASHADYCANYPELSFLWGKNL